MIEYIPSDWYWIVAEDAARPWSSAARAYVDAGEEPYQTFLARGGLPTPIASEADLWDVLRARAPDRLPDDAPQPVPATISFRQLVLQLFATGQAVDARALAARTVPPGLQAIYDGLPSDQQTIVTLTLATMTEADRVSPLIDLFAAGYGWGAGEADDFFRAAAGL